MKVAKRSFANHGGCTIPKAFKDIWLPFAEFLTDNMIVQVAQEHSRQYINPTARVHYTLKTVFFETELEKALGL